MPPPKKNMTTGLSRPPGRVGLVEAKLPEPPPTAEDPRITTHLHIPAPPEPKPEATEAVKEARAHRREVARKNRHPLVAAFRDYVGDAPEADEWAGSVWSIMADHARYSTSMSPALSEVLIRIATEIEEGR